MLSALYQLAAAIQIPRRTVYLVTIYMFPDSHQR